MAKRRRQVAISSADAKLKLRVARLLDDALGRVLDDQLKIPTHRELLIDVEGRLRQVEHALMRLTRTFVRKQDVPRMGMLDAFPTDLAPFAEELAPRPLPDPPTRYRRLPEKTARARKQSTSRRRRAK